MKHALITLFVALAVAGLCAASALALDSAGSGFWDDDATWDGIAPVAGDDVVITNGNTVTIRTNTAISVQSLTIQTNGVLTHSANTTTALGELYKVVLDIANDLTVELGGKIDVDSKGYSAVNGPGKQTTGTCSGSHGGKGIGYGFSSSYIPGPTYGSITSPTNCGSGGSSTSGGGAIQLMVGGTSDVDGVITAGGNPNNNYYTGSGGSVFLTTGALSGDGTIRANGADAGHSRSGGGGRVAVILTNSTNFGSVTLQALGGLSPASGYAGYAGTAGTVYMEHTGHAKDKGRLVVDYSGILAGSLTRNTPQNEYDSSSSHAFSEIVLTNGAVYLLDADDVLDITATTLRGDPSDRNDGIYVDGGTLTVPAAFSFSNCFITVGDSGSTFNPSTSLTVGTNGTIKFDVPWAVNYPITLESGGWMSHSPNSTTAAGEQYKLDLTINGDLNIQTGAQVNVDAMGYLPNNGPGKGSCGTYGGKGSLYSSGQSLGPTYGSISSPTNIGSGGTSQYGGGAVLLTVTGTTTVHGAISAAGGPVTANYGGSGGSVFLTTGTLTGDGTISANGGKVSSSAPGGGGRVAVVLTNSADFGDVVMQAYGGDGAKPAAPGTVYRRISAQGPGQGTLTIDANNRVPDYTSRITTEIGSLITDAVVGTVIVTNQAILTITNQTLTVNGSWSNAATFVAQNNSTVILASTNAAAIQGHNTFYNLVCTNTDKVVAFQDGKTNAVAGTLTLANTTLDSTSGSTSWFLKASANTHSVSNVTVGHSDALSGAPIPAFDSTDLGGNFNWTFAESGFNTNIWTGAVDSDWGTAGNWSRSRSTIDTDTVVIPGSCPNYPLLDFDKQLLSLVISNGASLSLNGYPLTVDEDANVSGTLTATGSETLTFYGDLDFSGGGTFTPASSTVLLPGDITQSVVSAGNAFYQLTISASTGQVTFADSVVATNIINLGTLIKFGGNVTAASAFETQGTNVTFGGTVTAPSFYNTGGALVFSGTVSTVSFTNLDADVTFHDDLTATNFTCAPGGMDLTFEASKTYTIGNFLVYGQAGALMMMRSSDTANWNLDVTDRSDVRHVNVEYSDADSGETIHPLASTDSGNNPNWDFGDSFQTWVGTSSAVFTNANNWVPAGAPDSNANLLIDGYYATAPILSGVATVAQVIVGGNVPTATLTVNGTLTTLGDMEVQSEGTVTHSANSTTALGERYKLNLTVNGNLDVQSEGQINVDAKGYSPGQGPGAGAGACGSYGGEGSLYYDYQGIGPTYGSITAPTNIGSGGNNQYGGGAVRLNVAGTTTVNGAISAAGGPVTTHYSGSGGSVFLTTGALTGNGTISANGGRVSNSFAASGGGGRVAVILTNAVDFGNVSILASTGSGGNKPGAAGTVYRQTQAQGPDRGTLVIDANNMASYRPAYNTLINGQVTDRVVGSVIITNQAIVEIAAGQSLTANGSWLNMGTFIGTNTGSTVTLAGTSAATVQADNTFYNLTAGAAGKTILFEAGKTTTVNGKLIFIDDTTLLSTADGTQWGLDLTDPTGTQEVGRVTVKDSDATPGLEILAGSGSTDLGNNLNWSFPVDGSLFRFR